MSYEISFDTKKILIEDQWFSLEDLGNKIKESIATGNYKIKKWSDASEQLQTVLESSKKISFIIPKELYDCYALLSEKKQVRLELLLKRALENYIASENISTNSFNQEPKTDSAKPKIIAEEKPQEPAEEKSVTQTIKQEPVKPQITQEIKLETEKPKIIEQPKAELLVNSEENEEDISIEEDQPIIIEELIVKKKPPVEKTDVSSAPVIIEKKQPPVIVDTKSGLSEDEWFK